MITNLHAYPSALRGAIDLAICGGALVIERQGQAQVWLGRQPLLLASFTPDGWLVSNLIDGKTTHKMIR